MKTDWPTALTALVALYGAILSTYTLIVHRRDALRRIKVEFSMGFITHGPELSDSMIILTAANPGSKPVTLNMPSIQLPNGRKLFDPYADAEVQFPHELTEGKSCKVWFPAKGIAQTLVENGFTGNVCLAGEFSDAVGTVYTSKPLKFDVKKWVKG